MNRYAHSFLISSFLYGILVFGFLFIMTKSNSVLGEQVVKVMMLRPQEEVLEQKQSSMAKIEEDNQKQPKDESIKKIEKPKPIKNDKSMITDKQEVSKQKDQANETKEQQSAQKAARSSEAEKNQFLIQLKSEIRKNKRYPKVARGRGQEGVVEASFRVNQDGSVSKVVCHGEYSVLNNAAKEAIRKAFPVKISQNIATVLPLELSLVLDFKLLD